MKRLIIIILLAVLVFAGWQLYGYFREERDSAEIFQEVRGRLRSPPPIATPPESNDYSEPETEWTVFDRYGDLFAEFHDMIGWIHIDGTPIDYPVMHRPNQRDFYLNRNFRGQHCNFGTPYIFEQASIDPHSGNITIFGHNMRGERMFGSLDRYRNESFFIQYPIINFDTRAGFGRYEIMAVFTVYWRDFPYHTFVDFADQEAFDEFIERCLDLAFYYTGVTAEYGDNLITLSTCVSGMPNYRLAIVARKIQ